MLRIPTISKHFFCSSRVPVVFYSQRSTLGAASGAESDMQTKPMTSDQGVERKSSQNGSVQPSQSSQLSQAALHLGRMESIEKHKKHMSKTEAADAALRAKLEEFVAGDGGASGVEYENGNPADVKRAVRENMFRVI